MRRYSTIHPLFMSFYSKDLYKDVAENWRKISFLYLFLLLAVCLIPIMFKIHSRVSDFIVSESPKYVKQVPTITISKGKVSVDAEMPYFIKDPERGSPLVIIDTTGKVVSLQGSEAHALLTQSKLIIKDDSKGTREFDLSQIENLVIDQSKIYDWLDVFLEYFVFFLYPFALLSSFLLRSVQALVFAIIGMFLARNMKIPLTYKSSVGLAIVSMTPAVILNMLYDYVDIEIPFWRLIDLLIALVYLHFAVKSNSKNE